MESGRPGVTSRAPAGRRSSTRTSACGSVYSSLNVIPVRMSSRWRTVAPR